MFDDRLLAFFGRPGPRLCPIGICLATSGITQSSNFYRAETARMCLPRCCLAKARQEHFSLSCRQWTLTSSMSLEKHQNPYTGNLYVKRLTIAFFVRFAILVYKIETASPYPLIFSSGLGTGNGMIATQQSAAKVTYGTFIINSATHPST
ncbi:hypothetical protein BpHYR1_052586 [Brachionus plicatilis]|uniref:Uncharacterized protein n=1 Tax=Brachionus plicatilis TaxID=10195 RepID=A0A3M7S483_BRAPC|nr:hypothetical protein BpHYR1_052586 [Brachionus plicatilis]